MQEIENNINTENDRNNNILDELQKSKKSIALADGNVEKEYKKYIQLLNAI